MLSEEVQTDQFVMLQARAWIDATKVSGERLLSWTQTRQDADSRFRRTWEGEMFVFAAQKLARWAFLAKVRNIAPPNAFKAILAMEPLIKEVCDMFAHADDHVVGIAARRQAAASGGRAAAQPAPAPSPPPTEATTSVVIDGELFVAGRLSVKRVLEAVREAHAEFEHIAAQSDTFRWLIR